MLPGQTSGTSMFPPNGPGDSVVIASSWGATASVPMKGSHGSATPTSSFDSMASASRQTHTRSGRGSWSVRVMGVEVSPPK